MDVSQEDQETKDYSNDKTSLKESENSEKKSKQNLVSLEIGDMTKEGLWDVVGFHRPLAGFWYNLAFYILMVIFAAIFSGVLFKYFYPYPESLGYKSTATGIFGLFFTMFDLGTAKIMDRFVGESNIKNPKKMILYIQYFIWYQMITGLIQTTAVSYYALFFVPRTELAYAVWIMLIHATTQYPGFLGVFKNTLGSLQQFNKTAILDFISGQVFQRITDISFVLLGRFYGIHNPAVGEIMGIAIGSTIGFYVDDFITMAVSAKYFKNIIEEYGYSVRDCFRHDFDKRLFWECFSFGVKIGFPLMLWTVVSFVELFLWIRYVPQYTTFATFAYMAEQIGGAVAINLALGGAVSESYMNGKKNLARYYLGQSSRFTGLIQFLMLAVILLAIQIMAPIFTLLDLAYYIPSIPFIFPRLIRNLQQPYNNNGEDVLIGTDNPNISMWLHLWENLIAILTWIILIVWLEIPQTYGLIAVAWLIPCAELLAIVSKVILTYLYIHKKVFKVKIPVWQTFIAPFTCAIVVFILGTVFYQLIFPYLDDLIGVIPALIFFIVIIILAIAFVYLPLSVLLGGWDEGSLASFKKVTKISGPSKFIVKPVYTIVLWTSKRSKLHNKFKMDDTKAIQEAKELMIIKNKGKSQ
ncbi:MAG: hypothetical protein GF364_21445 [Candidatus Lokiarchaeota archaeon]|nr:hypothetical protein [Candidatus Lokiarchaeota archaeon]